MVSSRHVPIQFRERNKRQAYDEIARNTTDEERKLVAAWVDSGAKE